MNQEIDQRMAKSIVVADVYTLLPYLKNSRTHSEEQIKQIAASIQEFGFNTPILVDGKKGIIAGHGRLEAAKLLNLKTVPIIELTHLSENQKRAYIIADNKLAENAGWDYGILQEEMSDLSTADYDLSPIGFSEEEIKSFSSQWESKIESDGEALEEKKEKEKEKKFLLEIEFPDAQSMMNEFEVITKNGLIARIK